MIFIYNLFAHITYFFLKISSYFNPKMKLFITGRKETFSKLASINTNDKVLWIHAASLGEFEQARPIIENLKILYANHKIVVTFFSPSGYKIRKNYPLADVVCYLPFDTRLNVKKFITTVQPKLAILIKYEFWPNLLFELKKSRIPTILVSGIFRKKQHFFSILGFWTRSFLNTFQHFFVQDENSKHLLNHINFYNTTVSGDTRFDRVLNILEQNNTLDFITAFKNNKYTTVAGSTWKEDEKLLVEYINTSATAEEKFILAPHNINPSQIKKLKESITKKVVLYSEINDVSLSNYQVLIVDTIGLLTKIYAYADVAYVGGGLATGLHNILEPATFGIPIVFGDQKHQKFKEAVDLKTLNGAESISNYEEMNRIFTSIREDQKLRLKMGETCQNYVAKNAGATPLIIDYIKTIL